MKVKMILPALSEANEELNRTRGLVCAGAKRRRPRIMGP